MTALALLLFLVQDATDLKKTLSREIIGPKLSMEEIQDFIEPRVPAVPEVKSAAEWKALEADLRKRVVEGLFYRGEAGSWAAGTTRVEWAGETPGGPGYAIRKLRYEAVPGLWIPALLYVPEKRSGKIPVHLAVNGHDGAGKAADYKQMRCINLAKRGVMSLNIEWFGMGQLNTPGYNHSLMNQLDLCGTAGLAPFFLSMKRGLDVLLSLENADPARVAVSGLSGGSWQTISISSLDTRVTLTNPVAGYSSFKTRVRHLKDLGDSEQTPSDLATVADYAHLTAMMAPRATLLTFNAKDNCCFESNYALQPLMDAAQPVFHLLGAESNLRCHVNHDPGTHNFGLDNRQALYRMILDHFFPDHVDDAIEIPSENEVKKPAELAVELPKDNATFTTLARALAADLPRAGGTAAMLRERIRAKDYKVTAGTAFREGNVAGWKLMMGKDFTVPAVEIAPAEPKSTVLIFSENGRASVAAEVQAQLDAGRRVIAIDPFYYGESKIASHGWLFAITAAAVGERPLGLQASQIAAAARWAESEFKQGPVTVIAGGPRASVVALAAAALEAKAIGALQLHQPMESLKELIEKGVGVDKMPELFCFGLLHDFDMKELVALASPRTVEVRK